MLGQACLRFRRLPHEIRALPPGEKAFVMAVVRQEIADENQQPVPIAKQHTSR